MLAKHFHRVLTALALATVSATTALAQAGVNTGRVIDATTKQPLADVNLIVLRQTETVARGATRQDGTYRISNVAPGEYTDHGLMTWLDWPLARSLAWQRFFGRSRNPTGADLDLYVAIVVESARLTRQRFPGSAFRMLLWDGRNDPRIDVIEKRVTRAGIPVHRLTAIIPDFEAQSTRYLLSRHDGHPNPRMHPRFADYVADILARN